MMLGVAAVCAVCLALIIGVASILAWRITRPGVHTYWDEYTFVPSDMGVPFSTIRFSTDDGLTLTGWLMEREGSRAVVVMGSGYRDRKTSLLPIAAGLWRSGLSVFLFDFRNQGDSDMDTVQTMGEREQLDMTAALDEVERRLPGRRIGAFGWSMGGAVALMTAARDVRVGAVVADSAFADQASVIAFNFQQSTRLPAWPFVPLAYAFIRLRAGYWPQRVRPVDAIGDIAPRPVLLIHGERDDMCPAEHARRLLHAAGATTTHLWMAPSAKHVGAYFADPAAYVARVAEFFHRSLGVENMS